MQLKSYYNIVHYMGGVREGGREREREEGKEGGRDQLEGKGGHYVPHLHAPPSDIAVSMQVN